VKISAHPSIPSRGSSARFGGQHEAVLTSASVNDSQVAIPLAQMSAARVTALYALMDSAYDAPLSHWPRERTR